jgi:hypothetical protein
MYKTLFVIAKHILIIFNKKSRATGIARLSVTKKAGTAKPRPKT